LNQIYYKIKALLKKKNNNNNSEKQKTTPDTENNEKNSNKRKRNDQESDEERRKKKKLKNREKRPPQKESTGELLKILQLNTEDLETGYVVSQKDFPETATDFFDQIGAWFSSVVASKQQQLDQQNAKPHMYQ